MLFVLKSHFKEYFASLAMQQYNVIVRFQVMEVLSRIHAATMEDNMENKKIHKNLIWSLKLNSMDSVSKSWYEKQIWFGCSVNVALF